MHWWDSYITICAQRSERKHRRIVEKEARGGSALDFKAYSQNLETVPSFPYLGYTLLAVDDACLAVVTYLPRIRERWSTPSVPYGCR